MVAVTGSAADKLKALLFGGAGREHPRGAAADIIKAARFAATAVEQPKGTAAARIDPVSVNVPAKQTQSGVLAVTLAPPRIEPPTRGVESLRVPAASPVNIIGEQWVTVHTRSGITAAQFGPTDMTDLTWTRELRDVSRFEMTLADVFDTTPLAPWVHWVSVYDGDSSDLMWTGPIQKITRSRSDMQIKALDPSALMARTRNPMTKRWEGVYPTTPAGELWAAMIELHGLHTAAVVRADPDADYTDFAVKADEQMLDKTISDLAGLGLRWTVVAGVPLLGPASVKPVATLGQDDFLSDFQLVRDGTAMFNDLLLRGPDNLARAHADLHGLNLQTIVNVDSMFGLSNVDRAATQYVRHTAEVRDAIDLPEGGLHPQAGVSMGQLIPSAKFAVDAYGTMMLMELENVTVAAGSGSTGVSIKMESFFPRIKLPELTTIKTGAVAAQAAL